jgi:hypothetical protein
MTISLEKPSPRSATLQRRDATWQDYLDVRDSSALDWRKIAFHENWLFVDSFPEGLAHACFSDLMTMVLVQRMTR